MIAMAAMPGVSNGMPGPSGPPSSYTRSEPSRVLAASRAGRRR